MSTAKGYRASRKGLHSLAGDLEALLFEVEYTAIYLKTIRDRLWTLRASGKTRERKVLESYRCGWGMKSVDVVAGIPLCTSMA